MNREEALATLDYGEARFKIEVGMLLRGSFRRYLTMAGCDYYEDKGFIESLFVIKGNQSLVVALVADLKRQFPEMSV